MFLVEKCFVVTVVLLSVVDVKVQSLNVPYCEDTVALRSTPALICYNYKILPPYLKNATEIRELRMKGILKILKNGELVATNLVNLEFLEIKINGLQTIELGAFRGGNKIKYLDLIGNLIKEIDLRVFIDLPSLQELFLNANPLKFLSDAEFPNLNLTYLSLHHCGIHSIPPNLFRNLEKLETVDLYGNQLKFLEWKTFLPLKNLKQVRFWDNPFHCDCQVKFLFDFLDSKNVSWLSGYTTSCESSSTPYNEKLINVGWDQVYFYRQQLVCPPVIKSIYVSKPSNNQTLNGNKMIFVDCEYEGYPEPNVTWTKDEKPLPFRSGVTIQTQRDDDAFPEFNFKFKQTLTIPSSLAFHGSYECHIFPDLVATLNVDANNLPRHTLPPPISTTSEVLTTTTEVKSIRKTTEATPPTENVYKSSSTELPSTNIIPTTNFDNEILQTTVKVNIPNENANSEIPLQLICIVLVLIVGLLLGVIITSGVYIAVRYSKIKRRQLPKKIYSIIPREPRPNSAPQTGNLEDPPYPSLAPSLGRQENAYEICGNAEVHFYEVPVIPPVRLHPIKK